MPKIKFILIYLVLNVEAQILLHKHFSLLIKKMKLKKQLKLDISS